jgi:hypothetical protein
MKTHIFIVFRVNWICVITICTILKDTITIQVTALVPLQFCTCLKYAILYARRRLWPTCRRIGGHRTSVWTGLPSPQRIRPSTPSVFVFLRPVPQLLPPQLLTLELEDRRRLPSVAHHRRKLEMKSAASSSSSSQIGDLPRIECPRCHIKVIKTKSRKDEVYYKCPNHFKTVCWL